MITFSSRILLIPVSAAALLAAASDQPWKDAKAAAWSDEDAKLVLTDSPWAKQVTPIVNPESSGYNPGMGRPGGRRGGMGGGYPGGGYPGGGYPGGGYPGGGGGYPSGRNGGNYPSNDPNDPNNPNGNRRTTDDSLNNPKPVTLRWESAEPVQAAILKTKDSNAPVMHDNEYAIVVSGLPNRVSSRGSSALDEKKLKGDAALKRDSGKKIRPTSVKVMRLEEGTTVIYYFSRKDEISLKDRMIEFDAKIGRYEIDRPFVLSEMVYDGKLSL